MNRALLSEMRYTYSMIKALEHAISELARLPEADQEQISRELVAHVQKLQALRDALDLGVKSLDAGNGQTLDIEELIQRKNAGHVRG
ncbi:hypothetical protein [Bradyrhizobium sp. HKCCYLS20291]|uniref:hypothetical protein n=1 Tax=Bradyrhizobium sp. HKCCYLS20291 TaxID=3420766 RepID=UPI003EB85992